VALALARRWMQSTPITTTPAVMAAMAPMVCTDASKDRLQWLRAGVGGCSSTASSISLSNAFPSANLCLAFERQCTSLTAVRASHSNLEPLVREAKKDGMSSHRPVVTASRIVVIIM